MLLLSLVDCKEDAAVPHASPYLYNRGTARRLRKLFLFPFRDSNPLLLPASKLLHYELNEV